MTQRLDSTRAELESAQKAELVAADKLASRDVTISRLESKLSTMDNHKYTLTKTLDQLKNDGEQLKRERKEAAGQSASSYLMASSLDAKLKVMETENQSVRRLLSLWLSLSFVGCLFLFCCFVCLFYCVVLCVLLLSEIDPFTSFGLVLVFLCWRCVLCVVRCVGLYKQKTQTVAINDRTITN